MQHIDLVYTCTESAYEDIFLDFDNIYLVL